MTWNLVSYVIEKLGIEGTAWAMLTIMGGVLICMVIPYLLGSFNFGLIISKKKYNDDIRNHGSGNAGTTNMLRTYGKGAAVLTLIGDMLKAVIAVMIGYLVLNLQIKDPNSGSILYYDKLGASIAGLFVMLGHMFPCFYKFKGGKGVATAGTVVLMINPIVFAILFIVFLIIVIGTKYVSLGSIMGLSLYPIVLVAFDGPGSAALFAVAMACLVVYKHKDNIKRLRDGKESKLSFGKGSKKKVEDTPTPTEAPSVEDSDDNYTECTGCKHLIPITRAKCAYCGTVNEKCPADSGKKSKKKQKK